jgi:hypothetical protein
MVAFARMLSLDDNRWTTMHGGYKMPFDPRPLFARLEAGLETEAVWSELWNELHHQGDVDEASYAAVPHLVRIYRKRAVADWNIYAMVAIIDLARACGSNPGVPEWLAKDYFGAITELAEIGATEVLTTDDTETVRAILGVIAIAKNLRTYGELLVKYSEDELPAITRAL